MLYIVATPIGNLEDITHRALRTLREVDFVLCEDTRVTKKLLSRYDIHTQVTSYHQHSTSRKNEHILSLLREGKRVALVTDSGTPGISDPGNNLVRDVRDRLPSVLVSPVPGPSAVIAAASVCGLRVDSFLFLGFLPHKKGRKKKIRDIACAPYTVIIYESPHRIQKLLRELREVLAPSQHIFIGRELTKKYEQLVWCTAEELLTADIPARGEFVLIIERNQKKV